MKLNKALTHENINGGDEGNRTPDLLIANETLSRLSYVPTQVFFMS